MSDSAGPLAGGWAAAALMLAVIGLAALWGAWRRVRGTTLTAAWWWAVLSLVCVAGTELVVALLSEAASSAAVEAARFAAAVSTFCPAMAVLGAKRPQHVAWQFIVLSLWCVLVLPSGEELLFGCGGGLEVDVVRSWFLLILVGMALINALPTRFAACGLLVAGGQLILLWRFLPLPTVDWGPAAPLWGFALLVTAGVLFALDWPRASAASDPLDRVWRDFRDLYGAAWALRVAQRINASSAMYGWGVTLTWQGFVVTQPTAPLEMRPDVREAIKSSLETLLRRFVSPEWIAARLGSLRNIPAK